MAIVIIGWSVLGTLIGFAIAQSIYVWLHCRFLGSNVVAKFDDSFAPNVAIILCVRGSDPSLVKCLAGIAQQDYLNYEIHVVADDPQDPALQTVREFFSQKELPPATIHVLSEHDQSRSLKCSSIICGVSELDDSIEVVALIDADTIADRNWLNDLVQPLADPSIGATTGNRWFAPAQKSLAAEVRQAWNAAAICQMTCYQIPWGGSLALKRSTIQLCELLKNWSDAFCEDTMLTRILKAKGLRMVRVPTLVVANDESTTMTGTYQWIVRQLLTVRLYHRDWPLVLLHGAFLGMCMIAVLTAIVMLYWNGEPKLGSLLLVMLVLFEIAYVGLFAAIRSANLGAIESRGLEINNARPLGTVMPAILMTQLLYPAAVFTAATTKRVSWRGIDYAIGPGNKITMQGYSPYHRSVKPESNAGQVERSIS